VLTTNGDLRLLDFGVARARFAARESSTGQLVLGTLNYMAPDYIITGAVHPALDVYSLALTLWEISTGEVYGQPKVREDSHLTRLEQNMGRLGPGHAQLAPVLRRMLSWEPSARPEAGEVAVALGALLPKMTGESLQDFAETTVPPILADRPVTEDTEGFIGRVFQIGPPPGAPHEVTTQKAGPISAPADVPTARQAKPPRANESGATTDIGTPKTLTRHLSGSNSVTMQTPSAPGAAHPPPRSSRSAILGGVLIGGFAGLIALAVLATLLFG
jgi:serine/threonine protein kinase